MSDEDYAAFLNKANKDYSGSAKPTAAVEEGISETAHPAIRAIGVRAYTSDADELFVDTTLEWEGEELPSEDEFQDLVGGEVCERLSLYDWDVTDSYTDVSSAVREAAGGSEPVAYRVTEGLSRNRYYVVALDKSKKQLVGVKALAIES
ncbi:hypothetical protein ABW20_dc0107620 [Dactylellina cionopaga]|nr:hypothetical protein ABW20_dc0107620 [Dactylellina cionopaga]